MDEAIAKQVTERLARHVRERTHDAGAQAHTRPVSDYTDPARFAAEIQALFRELPMVVAHTSQLAKPGDFLTDDRLGVPLLLTRTAEGRVAAHLNVCPHRSAIVESERCGNRSQFVCPYHSWTFGIDGKLLRMTDSSAFEGLERPPAGLKPVAVVEKYGLIFVRIAGEGSIDIDAFLGPMAPVLAALGLEEYEYFGTKQTEVRCNWKVFQEGSLETYHFNGVHGRTIARQFDGMAHVFDQFGDHQRFVVPRRKFMERHERGESTRDQMLPTFFLFPNTAFTVPHDHLMFVQVFPRDVRSCLFENALFVRRDSREKDRGHWERALELTQSVNAEDFSVVESIQRAQETAPLERVIHGRYEQGLTAFHTAIDREIARSTKR